MKYTGMYPYAFLLWVVSHHNPDTLFGIETKAYKEGLTPVHYWENKELNIGKERKKNSESSKWLPLDDVLR